MVTLNLLDSSVLLQIIIIIIACVISFLAIKAKGFTWFVACFAWAGVIVLWLNIWVQGIAVLMAVVSLAMFITSATSRR